LEVAMIFWSRFPEPSIAGQQAPARRLHHTG
jgi:hypothetical protein